MLVCTLGDLTLDVIVRLAGPIAAGGDTDAEIRIGPGGQAANVAAWAAALGASARFIGKTGADDAGGSCGRGSPRYGVEIVGPIEGRNGVDLLARLPGRRALDGRRPRRRARAPRRRDRPAGSRAATTCTSPATR